MLEVEIETITHMSVQYYWYINNVINQYDMYVLVHSEKNL